MQIVCFLFSCSFTSRPFFFSYLFVFSLLKISSKRVAWWRNRGGGRARAVTQFNFFAFYREKKNKKGIEEIHTKLYSRKLSCKIVSLTAANTKRMFSVSAKQAKNKFYLKIKYKKLRNLEQLVFINFIK